MNLDFLKHRMEIEPHVAAKSKTFIEKVLGECEHEVRKADTRLNSAEEDNDEDTYTGGSVIAKADQNFQEKEALRDHAERKLDWENRKEYEKRIPTDTEKTKRLLAETDWKNIRRP